jgi:DNA-binding transcriptional regulator LsrR (DeoR family)
MSKVEQMHPLWRLSECKVVQIQGGVGLPSVEKHANCLVSQLAYLVQGEAHLLPAPGLVASRGAADVLAQDPQVSKTMALFDQITVASMSGIIVNRGLLQAHDNSSKAAVIHLASECRKLETL